jgi:hypothetical protein
VRVICVGWWFWSSKKKDDKEDEETGKGEGDALLKNEVCLCFCINDRLVDAWIGHF